MQTHLTNILCKRPFRVLLAAVSSRKGHGRVVSGTLALDSELGLKWELNVEF